MNKWVEWPSEGVSEWESTIVPLGGDVLDETFPPLRGEWLHLPYFSSPVCMCHIRFIRSSVDRHWDCLHLLAIVNSAAMNFRVHIPFWIVVFSGCIPSSGISGSHGTSLLNILRNFHTVLHSGSIKLHFHHSSILAWRIPWTEEPVYVLATPPSMWDLSPTTRDWTQGPCTGSTEP